MLDEPSTLGAERRQSTRNRTFRRSEAKVRFVPRDDIQSRCDSDRFRLPKGKNP